jgi:hypothetical protein
MQVLWSFCVTDTSKTTGGSQEAQTQTFLEQIAALKQRGAELRHALAKDPSNPSTIAATRWWQEHCGVTIHQLSGGSKAHWLARSFSDAFLVRSASGEALERATTEKIVTRLLDVLEKAEGSLSRQDAGPMLAITPSSVPTTRRFDFVPNADLRPVVEQAYTESKRALEEGEYDEALRTSCGILEAIVTDALGHKGLAALASAGAPGGEIADWSFETRLAIAEKVGLIRGGWLRLPEAARRYREPRAVTVSERDARVARQVLHVIMRDLNPGR